ncbi:MAG: hypothetical protein IKB30_01440 [Clostridia bacterium]|nr:hypothetical protein [Clostridia bacterium]MBR2499115.1 hypothetical protein [Clostridia bacterium]
MKRKIILIFTLIMSICLSLCVVIANADNSIEKEDAVILEEIVTSNGGEVAFKKIDPFFDKYNINRKSDAIDTVGTIDEVLVLSTESANTVFTFKTHLNRDHLSKYFNIVEWFIVPTNLQTFKDAGINGPADSDFESFEITIKDVNNPDKYVVFRTTNRPDSSTYRNVVSGRVGANGQSVEGFTAGFMEVNRNWGAGLKASHVGCFSALDGVPEGYDPYLPLGGFLSIDEETKCVYSVTGQNKGERLLVRDLDEGTHMIGTDVPWTGFESNELEVSIRFINITSGRKASVAILGFNGMDFTKGEIVDEISPTVIQKTQVDGKLCGEVNRPMPVMDFYAYDALDGYINQTESKVYYNYNKASQVEYKVVNGRFTPDKAGIYYIVTTSKDRFGNTGKLVTPVEIKHVIPDIEISLEREVQSKSTVGETISLPKPIIYGGTINKDYRIEVFHDGKTVEIEEDIICINKQGVYTVRYVVWDYYGQEFSFDYFLNAMFGDKPTVEFPVMPENVVAGTKVVVPEFKAIDYISFSDTVDAIVKYEIKEPNDSQYRLLDSNSFVPQNEGEYKLKITVSQVTDLSNTIEKEYLINCKECNLVSDYFIRNSVELVEFNNNFVFKTVGETGRVSFVNAISNENLQFEFNFYDSSTESQIKIRLYDSLAKENYVDLTIKYENTRESLLIVGDKSFVINGAPLDRSSLDEIENDKIDGLKSATLYDLSYVNGWIYDGNTSICMIDKYANGKTFNGFASGKVFFEMFTEKASGNTAVEFSDFCGNKDFTVNATDITYPTISLSSVGRIANVGDIVSFTYSSYDLFDTECKIDVTITKGKDSYAVGKDGKCSFIITDFGSYRVSIEAYDKEGNTTYVSFNIECFDNIAPSITLKDNVTTKIKLGKSLELPKAIVLDNVDSDLTYAIYARTPYASYRMITNHTFTPDIKGEWIIYYYVQDNCGNYAVQTYYINVV